MTCPVCGEKTSVAETKNLGDHVIRRRRCTVCDYDFYTEEIDNPSVEAEFRELYAARNKERKLAKMRLQNG